MYQASFQVISLSHGKQFTVINMHNSKGPVKLIWRVKIADSFLQFVSNLFHHSKLGYIVLHMAVKEFFETHL